MGVWNISEDFSYPLFVVMPSIPTITAPTNGASGVTVQPLLDWEAGSPYVPVSYDIYLGTTSGSLTLLDSGRASTSIQIITDLDYNTTYYWRVDATDPNDTVTGTEWSFTTLGFAPPLPTGMTLDSGGEPTGGNNMVTIKRLVVAANSKIWYET